ncbi:MAG: class I SAM-dependent methyltransferase [Lachnospiraceae bacterium]|nr:class I SAM-dependent methyltransferase [Lachnospiraceae bacterium]
MNIYGTISKAYDLLDKTYFSEKGKNPRNVIQSIIPNLPIKVLDMCCGTLANTFSIAKASASIEITGVDISKEMLNVAEKKCQDANLQNVYLRCEDATNTKFKNETFDYVVIGLVLHEIMPSLRKKIINEAFRVLKKDGKLIILEWEQQKSMIRKLKFLPLYISESMGCLSFNDFYKCDKEIYFNKFNFHMKKEINCNYSVVMEFEK